MKWKKEQLEVQGRLDSPSVGREELGPWTEEKKKGKKDSLTSLISNWDNLLLDAKEKLHKLNKYRASYSPRLHGEVCNFCKK